MVRLRDRLGGTPPFAGMDLCYGAYDLGGTPSTIQQDRQGPVRDRRRHQPQALPAGPQHRGVPRPAISPLWAELHDLPPALITVGHRRLAAGRLALPRRPTGGRRLTGRARGLPGRSARHRGSAPTVLGKMARDRLHAFLRERVMS